MFDKQNQIKDLAEQYEISKTEEYLAKLIRTVRGTSHLCGFIHSCSKKKYGLKDNFARYYVDRFSDIRIGKYTWGYWEMLNANTSMLKSVGAFCSIAMDQLLLPKGHNMNYVSSWNNAFDKTEYDSRLAPIRKSVVIGNDVWIGACCRILNNVTIGDGAVIAAGSIITKDVPPYAVMGGVNKLIKYRFDEKTIDGLQKLKWWEWDDAKIFASLKLWHNPQSFLKEYGKF